MDDTFTTRAPRPNVQYQNKVLSKAENRNAVQVPVLVLVEYGA